VTAFTSFLPNQPTRALVWIPSSNTLVDLHPLGYKSSAVSATNGFTQAGFGAISPNGPTHAVLWSGSADSAVDINPAGATFSQAEGISPDGQVVGTATFGGFNHAILWLGTDAIDLHPATGYFETHAARTDGIHQVGGGSTPGGTGWEALVWSGSADSVINLHPSGYSASAALNVRGPQVVGYAAVGDEQLLHAALWDLTTGTFADLNGSLLQSAALATDVSTQVGSGQVSADGTVHAALWHGTADSYIDLHALLPGNYNYSRATGIDADGNISGVAFNADTRSYEAVVWLVPEPAGLLPVVAGALTLTRRRRRGMDSRPR
jgi:probable HAF family extracellular repeat protein